MRIRFYLRELTAKTSAAERLGEMAAGEADNVPKRRAKRRTEMTAVIASVNFGPHRLKLGTGVSILPRFWNTSCGNRSDDSPIFCEIPPYCDDCSGKQSG